MPSSLSPLRGQVRVSAALAAGSRTSRSVSEIEQDRARQIFDEVFAEEGGWPAAS